MSALRWVVRLIGAVDVALGIIMFILVDTLQGPQWLFNLFNYFLVLFICVSLLFLMASFVRYSTVSLAPAGFWIVCNLIFILFCIVFASTVRVWFAFFILLRLLFLWYMWKYTKELRLLLGPAPEEDKLGERSRRASAAMREEDSITYVQTISSSRMGITNESK